MEYTLAQALVRQQALIPLSSLVQKITIIGAGATGSVASLTLAKMGFANQEIYDGDEVDVVNMNCQMYGYKHIGMPKVDALKDMFSIFSKTEPITHHAMYDGDNMLDGIVICALDSMEGRRMLFDACKRYNVRWLIDPRMAIQYAAMHVVDMTDEKMVENYSKTLVHASTHAPCTMKSTMLSYEG